MKKRLTNIILVVALLFASLPPKSVYAATLQEIRVGLVGNYYNKSRLTIYNSKIILGYVNDSRVFEPEATFTSEDGFTFSSAGDYYVAVGETCSSYADALLRKKKYFQSKAPITGAITGKGEWQAYCGPFDTYAEAEVAAKDLVSSGATKAKVLGGSNYRLKMTWGKSDIIIDVDKDMEYPQFEAASMYEEMGYYVDLGDRVYRGRIEIGRYGKAGLTAVNIVPLEEYLYGVVSSEMPAEWPEEALKAQAVCSRSYALVKAGIASKSDAEKGYKIGDTTDSQVYRGVMFEKEACKKAVDATKGQLVCFNNKAVAAYYFSSGAGATESSSDVWGIDLPYLMAKADAKEGAYATTPWKVGYTLSELTKTISAYSKNVGPVSDLKIVKQSESGRVSLLRIIGENGSLAMQTTSIRNILGLKSTKITIVKHGDTPYMANAKNSLEVKEINLGQAYAKSAEGLKLVAGENSQYIVKSATNMKGYPAETPETDEEIWIFGLGSGHGVGMSQTGAAGMAEEGADYKEIISYYFSGCNVS